MARRRLMQSCGLAMAHLKQSLGLGLVLPLLGLKAVPEPIITL